MSRADEIFLQNCRDILSKGIWDTDQPVRPKWEDGTPAHTVKLFGIVNRYDLRREFPILTVRRQYLKSAIDELLWIWQKKSNNIHDLGSHVWDAWADETGSIGKAEVPSYIKDPTSEGPEFIIHVVKGAPDIIKSWDVGKDNSDDIVANLYLDPESTTNDEYILELAGMGDIVDTVNALDRNCLWADYRGKITHVIVGEGITSIGTFTFAKLSALKTVSLPEGLKTIGVNSFNSCALLEEIVIPSTVEEIGTSAFYACRALAKITFEDRTGNLWSIGDKAFQPSKANLRTTVICYRTNMHIQNYPWAAQGRLVEYEYRTAQ